MKNHVNCWNAKSEDKPISIQASNTWRKVQRLSVETEYTSSGVEAHDILRDEDIVRSPEKSEGSEVKMYKIYYIVSDETEKYYIGMTGTSLNKRMLSHKSSCSSGKKTPLYDIMRKYGTSSFSMLLVDEFDTKEECCSAEIEYIYNARKNNHLLLNLADGGEGGFVITDVDSWKEKLRRSRQGGKPSLGMRHTEKNKLLFSKVSKEYWKTQETYDSIVVTSVPFKTAKEKYGVSKTHYYRLKRTLSNVQC